MNSVEKVKQQIEKIPFEKSTAVAIAGGVMATLVTLSFFLGLQLVFQELSPYQLLAAMQRSSTTLCFAGITSASTIMPLMLTIFSFAKNSSREFPQSFYGRIKWIALFCVLAIFSGLLTLTVLSSPVQEVENVDQIWFRVIYFSVLTGLGIMVGTLGTIIILLYYAILRIINSLKPQRLRRKEQEEADR